MKRKILKETWPRKGVSVLTTVENSVYETEVLGGEQEGWCLPSSTKEEAKETHRRMHDFIESGDKTPVRLSGTLRVINPNRGLVNRMQSL